MWTYDTISTIPESWAWPVVEARRNASNDWSVRPVGDARPVHLNGNRYASHGNLIVVMEAQGFRVTLVDR